MNKDTWGEWFRKSSDKLLLATILFTLLGVTIHVSHDARDNDQAQFLNGLTNTFAGALITLVTGAVLGRKEPPPANGDQSPDPKEPPKIAA